MVVRRPDVFLFLHRHHNLLDPQTDQEGAVHRLLQDRWPFVRSLRLAALRPPGRADRQDRQFGGGFRCGPRFHVACPNPPPAAADLRFCCLLFRCSSDVPCVATECRRVDGVELLYFRRPLQLVDGRDLFRLSERQRFAARCAAPLRSHHSRRRHRRRLQLLLRPHPDRELRSCRLGLDLCRNHGAHRRDRGGGRPLGRPVGCADRNRGSRLRGETDTDRDRARGGAAGLSITVSVGDFWSGRDLRGRLATARLPVHGHRGALCARGDRRALFDRLRHHQHRRALRAALRDRKCHEPVRSQGGAAGDAGV